MSQSPGKLKHKRNKFLEGLPVIAYLSISAITLSILAILVFIIYLCYQLRKTNVRYTKMEAEWQNSSAAGNKMVGYRPKDAIFADSWEDVDDDVIFSFHNDQQQKSVGNDGVGNDPNQKQFQIGISYDQNSPVFNSNDVQTKALEYSTKSNLQPGTGGINSLRETRGISSEHWNNFNIQRTALQEFSNSSPYGLLFNKSNTEAANNADTNGEQKELKQSVGYLQEGNACVGQQIPGFQKCTYDESEYLNSCLKDDEIVAKYRERNRYRRWSHPVWKVNTCPKSIRKEKKIKVRATDNAKCSEQNDNGGSTCVHSMEREVNRHTLTTGKNFGCTRDTDDQAISFRHILHPTGKSSEHSQLRMNGDEIKDMTKARNELRQQWSVSERKSIQTNGLKSDESLSGIDQLQEKQNMELGVMRQRQFDEENSIIYFDYENYSRQKDLSIGKWSESLKQKGLRSEGSDAMFQQFFGGYPDDDDAEYDSLASYQSQYSGIDSRDILTNKTDEMLRALMISTYGSSTASNNRNFLCRTYSDSELVKQRKSRMGDALTGHYSFSTSNLRSRQMLGYNFISDYQKSRKKKKGGKSISLRLKELKKLIGRSRKKEN